MLNKINDNTTRYINKIKENISNAQADIDNLIFNIAD